MKVINYSIVKTNIYILILLTFLIIQQSKAQGTWTSITSLAPDYNGGVMLLLTDGTVITKTSWGGFGMIPGTTWDKLTPDSTGSYINGTWSRIATMANDRLYFSSWILNDGRVYIGGGENGAGTQAEIYDPNSNTWTSLTTPGPNFSDGNSENLPDGRLLLGVNTGTTIGNYYYDPVANTYAAAPDCHRSHDEAAWLKLPDSSILQVDIFSYFTERYIPDSNAWLTDANIPVMLYDSFSLESGAALLLPDGRGFFIGSAPSTAYYTPSGNSSPGTWAAGPTIPNALGQPDAAAAMMTNGRILMALSHTPYSGNHFPTPTSFYEFDYLTDSFIQLTAPSGAASINISAYNTDMLALPDGNILYTAQGSKRYYVYTPGSAALAAGKPTVSTVNRINCDTFQVTGTLFTGISEGASYGDDWAMSTNFPLVRLTSGSNVYYARTYNWNRYGSVMTGSAPDTTNFVLPAGLAPGTYSLQVVVNGNASSSVTINTSLTITPSSFSLCPGTSTTLSDSASVGIWSSSNTSIVTAGSGSGSITGVSAGNATITYSIGTCYNISNVTVNPLPAAITGSTSICIGSAATLSSSTGGGVWSSTNTSIAAIGSGTGLINAVSVGYDTIAYTLSTGCIRNAPVTVNPLPSSISGPGNVCPGLNITLTDAGGGTWSSASPGTAAIGSSSGIVTGVLSGTSLITYQLPTGCTTTATITVNPLPSTISGTLSLCPGSATTLTDGGGGTWTSGTPGVATIGTSTGFVSGISAGTTNITYTLGTGCYATSVFTVNPIPAVITGVGPVYLGSSVTLGDITVGGTWSSSNTGVASTGSSTGIVTGVSGGTATITYTSATGCYVTTTVTITGTPAPIAGTFIVCTGSTTTLTDISAGGTWSSSNTAIATAGSTTGVITGVAAGTATISYTISGTYALYTVTVNPSAAGISGTTTVCIGLSDTLSDATAGGTWSSSSTSVATVGTSTGIVTGVSAGTVTISYTTSCSSPATTTVTVSASINAGIITGATGICAGSATTLTDTVAGGVWSTSSSSIASVGSGTGLVTGVTFGSVIITYTVSSGPSCTGSVYYPFVVEGIPQYIYTAAGTGINLTSGDGGPASLAGLQGPRAICSDTAGNIYISDVSAGRIRKIGTNGIISTVAGNGSAGNTGDGGQATSAPLNMSGGGGVYVDRAGNIFISNTAGQTIRKVNASTGIINTICGTTVGGFSGDGGPASAAKLRGPTGICGDTSGNLYIADGGNQRIRRIDAVTGLISTITGTGSNSYSGDGGPGTAAALSIPRDVITDNFGNLFITDNGNNRIRKYLIATGIITTIAGTGVAGSAGDGSQATAAQLNSPARCTVDGANNLFISDAQNNKVRKVNLTTGIINTVIFNGTAGYAGDGGPATSGQINGPCGIAINKNGDVYISDGSINRRVRMSPYNAGIYITLSGPSTVASGTPVTFTAWSPMSAYVNYQWNVNGSNIAGATNMTYTDASPAHGNIYTCLLTLSPACATGYSVTSNSITISLIGHRTNDTTSQIQQIGNTGTASLFPNPAHDHFTLAASGLENGNAVIKVFNDIGKLVYTQAVSVTGNYLSEVIDIRQFPAGLFLVQINDASGKLIILKCIKN